MSYFSDKELLCKCGCGMNVSNDLLTILNKAREISKTAFVITSGARCTSHNKSVGGAKDSSHTRGLAVDIKYTDSRTKFKILEGLFKAGFKRIGDNVEKSFIHCDIDPSLPQEVFFKY